MLNQLHTAEFDEGRIEQYVHAGSSSAGLCTKYDVDIREFVILACLHDMAVASAEELAGLVGLSRTSVSSCIRSLTKNGLIRTSEGRAGPCRLTTDGLALIRKAG